MQEKGSSDQGHMVYSESHYCMSQPEKTNESYNKQQGKESRNHFDSIILSIPEQTPLLYSRQNNNKTVDERLHHIIKSYKSKLKWENTNSR